MLDELAIRGLGVIDEAVLRLGPGLTVVTGETGAGKTMVVTGLLLLFGGRGDAARVRSGATQAVVDGRVLLPVGSALADRVAAAGGAVDETPEGAELVLRRVVGANGRSRAHVGGAGAPVALLAELADSLVAVHGQADQLRLVQPDAQRAVLDRFAGVDTADLAAAYARWRAADAELADRTARAGQLRREADLLAHGIAEIEAAAPEADELAELNRLAARLSHADALALAARHAHDALRGGDDDAGPAGDAGTVMGGVVRTLSARAGEDAELDALAQRVAELAALTAELGAEFGAYADAIDADPQRLEQVQQRRALLTALVRKYVDEPEAGLPGVLAWVDDARGRLVELDVSDEALAGLRAARDAASAELAQLCADVSARRRDAAEALAARVSTELAGLAMAGARLVVQVGPRPPHSGVPLEVAGHRAGVTADGVDEVSLLLQSHAGSPPLPLGRGASGGELSRVMLALEVSLLTEAAPAADRVGTLVFDEVDAGVGGRAALEVGRRLKALGRDRQVLVVTHLAQVAAFADHHVVVDRPTGADVVAASDVRVVEGDDRLAELARMLSGSDTETARRHAAELLAESGSATPAPRGGARKRR